MVEPAARIRAFKPADKDLVQFMIGKGDMEPLAIANRQGMYRSFPPDAMSSLKNVMISSLFSPSGVGYMGRIVLHFHSAHGLVAKTGIRIHGLCEPATFLCCNGSTINVPLRLVSCWQSSHFAHLHS